MILSDTDIEQFTASLARDAEFLKAHAVGYGIKGDNLPTLIEARNSLNQIIALIETINKRAA